MSIQAGTLNMRIKKKEYKVYKVYNLKKKNDFMKETEDNSMF